MMITNIEDYFTKGCGRCERFDTPDCFTRKWVIGQSDLRQICLSSGLIETVKWAHPCYMHAGRNIAIIGAFRDNFRLTFVNAALMKDPEGILEKQGPNTKHADMICFSNNAEVMEKESVIQAYLKEAMGYAELGIKPPKIESEIEFPDELVDVLDADIELSEAFNNLTPGRQKSYAYLLNMTKNSATRSARIAKFRNHILAGKGATDR